MASIRDVAKKANVAPSTVSLVLNNTGYVSATTREKVEKAMKELDYVPNELARNLSRNKTNIIGIVIPDISHPFFASFVKEAEKKLYALGYKTMICGTIGRENIEQEFLDMLRKQVMDGIIMGSHSLDVDEYKKINRPLVAIDRYIDDNIPIIASDHKKGGRLAAYKLIENGCKNVVQIKGATIVNTPAHEYHNIFKQILEENNINVYDIEMGHNYFESENFIRVAEEVFKKYPNVDGILGADMAIVSCMRKAKSLGYKTPEDIKFIAYDGTYITYMSETNITSIVQPIQELADKAVNTIVNSIEGKKVVKNRVVLDVSLRDGDTTL